MLGFTKYPYKTQETCQKSCYLKKLNNCAIKLFNTYPSTLMHAPTCYKTQQICEKAVDSSLFTFMLDCVLNFQETQKVSKKCI